MRICRDCGLDETETRFYDPDTTSGIAAGNCCASCWVDRATQWRAKNRDRWNAARHRSEAKRRHGLTDEEYDELYADPKCAGCGARKSRKRQFRNGIKYVSRLVIDHDHKTGKVRGLLCHDCNRTIATAHDDPKILRALAAYLEA